MTDLLILGTDTDAGKTTFALLWLAALGDRYAYWKPVETGESDTERVRRLVPTAIVHAPVARFQHPVAPALAARMEGAEVPSPAQLAASAFGRGAYGHFRPKADDGSPATINRTASSNAGRPNARRRQARGGRSSIPLATGR